MTTQEIPLRPMIPERLRLAAKLGSVIPFIGTGVSQLGGCPGWEEFANAALRFFIRPKQLNHAQFDQLMQLSPRMKLSVAVGLEDQYERKIDFKSILETRDPNKKAIGDKVYGHLARLATTFITTNYDDWLDVPRASAPSLSGNTSNSAATMPPSKPRVLYQPETFTVASPAPNTTTINHIHGSMIDRDSMVLTTTHYLDRYASHQLNDGDATENQFLSFLSNLFLTKSILFIGYSLGELEILEYVIQKARGIVLGNSNQDQPPEEPRHYLLQGFFSHEATLMLSLREYYLRECNIELLPFSRDQKGWSQLIDVIEYLAAEIPIGGVLPSQQRVEMEGLLQ